VAILQEGLTEPVDVAIAPGGTIYVADRAGGRIAVFTAGFQPKGHFVAKDVSGLTSPFRPVAVMVDDDGSILVADANYPRLLRFSCSGALLGDVLLSSLLAPVQAAGYSVSNPLQLLAGPSARFVAGACRPPFPANDGGVLLARNQRYLRLLALKLSHSFATSGIVLTAALDSGTPGTTWHKIIVGAELPASTSITAETATADALEALVSTITSGTTVGSDLPWMAPQQGGKPIPFTKQVPDQLVQSPPGRYLRLRITLASDGTATPSLQWLKVLYPRVSYLDYLPRIYQRDPDAQRFLQHFLALFERVLTRVEDRYEEFSRWLNPQAAPLEMINWLGLLIDLTFDPSWPLARRRALVAAAMDLYRRRGTVDGLKRYIEIYTGTTPVILEAFLNRPRQPAFLGVGASVLGSGLALSHASAAHTPSSGLTSPHAHRFTVLVYPGDVCASETLLPVVDRIITVNKPAHTIHTLQAVYPDARVDAQSTIGVDLVVGGETAPGTELGAGAGSGQPAGGVLGVDTVLGNRRPKYLGPFPEVL
jgi:phage tail-like protein